MATIFLPNEYKAVAQSLCDNKLESTGTSSLSSYMELACLAAMVAYSENGNELEADSFENGNEIPSRIFEGNQRDGIVYLLALQLEKDGEILRDGRENDCWKIAERYAAAGMKILDEWLENNPSDPDGVETILYNMKRVANRLSDEEESESPIKIEI